MSLKGLPSMSQELEMVMCDTDVVNMEGNKNIPVGNDESQNPVASNDAEGGYGIITDRMPKTHERSLRPIHMGREWLISTIVSWMTTLSWPKTNSRAQTITPIGTPDDLVKPGAKDEPRIGLFKHLFSSALRRLSGRTKQMSIKTAGGATIAEAADDLRILENEAAVQLSRIHGNFRNGTARRHHGQILSHGPTVELVMDILREESNQAMAEIEYSGKVIAEHPERKDGINLNMTKVNLLHPAFRSYAAVGHVVEGDIDSDLHWVPGHMLSGLWIIFAPMFWTRINNKTVSRDVVVDFKLLRVLRKVKIYLGGKLEPHHQLAWHIPGFVKSSVARKEVADLPNHGRWDEQRSFDRFSGLIMFLEALKGGLYNHSSLLLTERTRRNAFQSMWYWLPTSMKTPEMVTSIHLFWVSFLKEAKAKVFHVALDSKSYGSDVRFRGSGSSNDREVFNILPIVPGEFVGRCSIGDRVLSGMKHFGSQLIAIKGSWLAWKCALGYDLGRRPVKSDEQHIYELGNGKVAFGWNVKYMITDDQLIASVSRAWVNHVNDRMKNLKTWNRQNANERQISPRILDMLWSEGTSRYDERSKHWIIPVLAFRRLGSIISNVRTKTFDQFDDWDILLNEAKFEEVGLYRRLPETAPPSMKSMGRPKVAIKLDTPCWDATSREKRAYNTQRRIASVKMTAFETDHAMDDEAANAFQDYFLRNEW
jgi:hypothetical protein